MNIETIKTFQTLKTPFYYYDTTLLQATLQAAINIRISEQFLSVRRFSATTVKDRAVVSNFLTVLVSN